ncbi:ABC transporter ATP-binding protein [Weissella confusa]|uniref:ATP-binding cassette domain-containing protein n=1 Tax=Weissella confusa TaxID=1583 RepID=UPI0022E5A9D8|nr:ABC transporter ATP-binding protein [Weissella confusa]
MLEVKNVSYRTGRRQILKGVTLQVEPGDIVGVLGENGAGKTTLMRVLAGLIHPEREAVITIDQQSGDVLKSLVSFIPNLNWAIKRDTVASVAKFYQYAYADFDTARWDALRKELKIDSQAKISKLSKGQLERVIFALTVSREAKVILLDEPFSGVDVMTRRRVLQSLLRWLPEASIVLMSTHEINEIESVIDRTLVIQDGQIIVDRDIDDIRATEQMSLEQYFVQVVTENRKGIES